jgi:hypothetical protein
MYTFTVKWTIIGVAIHSECLLMHSNKNVLVKNAFVQAWLSSNHMSVTWILVHVFIGRPVNLLAKELLTMVEVYSEILKSSEIGLYEKFS